MPPWFSLIVATILGGATDGSMPAAPVAALDGPSQVLFLLCELCLYGRTSRPLVLPFAFVGRYNLNWRTPRQRKTCRPAHDDLSYRIGIEPGRSKCHAGGGD